MKYPKFIKQGSTIGVCAPSSGIGKFEKKFQRSIDNLHAYGYQTKETASVRNESEPSNSSTIRAKEVEGLLLDKDVDMIWRNRRGFLVRYPTSLKSIYHTRKYKVDYGCF